MEHLCVLIKHCAQDLFTSVQTFLFTTVFESVSACLHCMYVCVVTEWFLSAAQTWDSILPKGPTVDLVTAAIFAYSTSSSTSSSSSSSSSSSLNLSHALSTSNILDEGKFSLTTHTESTYIYSFFHLPPASFRLSNQVSTLPKTLSKSNLLYWHDRGDLCCQSKVHQLQTNISIFLSVSPTQLPHLFISLSGSARFCISPLPPASFTVHIFLIQLSPFMPCSSLFLPPSLKPSPLSQPPPRPLLFCILGI